MIGADEERSGALSKDCRRLLLVVGFVLSAALIGCAFAGQLTANLHSEYFNIARALAAGKGFANAMGDDAGPTAWMPPLLPCLESFFLWIGGGERRVVVAGLVILHMVVLLTTGVLVLAVAAETTGRVGIVIAAVVFSLAVLNHFWYWFQLAHDCWVPLVFLDLLLAGICWLRPLETRARAAVWGVFGGTCALASPAVALAWGIVTLLLGWRQREWWRGLLILLFAALVLTPWTIRNYLTFGRLIPVKSNLAYEFFQTQCLQADGLLQASTFSLHPNAAVSRERLEYQRLGETAYLDLKWRQFQAAVANDPPDFCERVAARFLAATVWYVPFNRAQEARRPAVLWARRLAHPLPFIALLVLLGAAMRGPLPKAHWTVSAVYVVYLAPYVVASYYERYAVPLLAVKVLLVLWAGKYLRTAGPHSFSRSCLQETDAPATRQSRSSR